MTVFTQVSLKSLVSVLRHMCGAKGPEELCKKPRHHTCGCLGFKSMRPFPQPRPCFWKRPTTGLKSGTDPPPEHGLLPPKREEYYGHEGWTKIKGYRPKTARAPPAPWPAQTTPARSTGTPAAWRHASRVGLSPNKWKGK